MVATSLHCLYQGCSICNVVAKFLLGRAMSLNLNKMLLYSFNKTCCFIQVFVLFAMALQTNKATSCSDSTKCRSTHVLVLFALSLQILCSPCEVFVKETVQIGQDLAVFMSLSAPSHLDKYNLCLLLHLIFSFDLDKYNPRKRTVCYLCC